ncbi:MAG TPA: class I SAM-dependent methyltransferase [Mucilaginibacter sp.]|nr:class I SAM-dependent methyltransferase [Mucilaginibacter sp.]
MLEESNKLYGQLLREFGELPQAVNWKNKEAQEMRFQQLIKIIKTSGDFSINDLGCGLGDFVRFMEESALKFTYHGYDIAPGMIESAKAKFSTNRNVSFEVIVDPGTMKMADYTIESGIFNLRFDHTEESWLAHILKTLDIMNEKSRLGFAFNLLTKYSDKHLMRDDLYYADPCFLFDYCKKNFSKNVALLHDYQLYDFTILVRK